MRSVRINQTEDDLQAYMAKERSKQMAYKRMKSKSPRRRDLREQHEQTQPLLNNRTYEEV